MIEQYVRGSIFSFLWEIVLFFQVLVFKVECPLVLQTCKIESILEKEKLFLLSVDFRCSPKAWHEKLAREAANPRLSISLAVENLDIDENDKKDKVAENKEMNDQLT